MDFILEEKRHRWIKISGKTQKGYMLIVGGAMDPRLCKGLPKDLRELGARIARYGYEGLTVDLSRHSIHSDPYEPPREAKPGQFDDWFVIRVK